jgi:phosphatidylserine/phosphatidylglycerophosphate/cardiolipin synthase-like enzyme
VLSEPVAAIDPVPHIPFPTSGSYPVRGGNMVRPLIDGTAAFRQIHEAIEAARHSVWLTVTFILPSFRFPDQPDHCSTCWIVPSHGAWMCGSFSGDPTPKP